MVRVFKMSAWNTKYYIRVTSLVVILLMRAPFRFFFYHLLAEVAMDFIFELIRTCTKSQKLIQISWR